MRKMSQKLQKSVNPRFHVILIKPSKYDDDGYVISWLRGIITSNSLACLNALTENIQAREVLGPNIEIVIHRYDETVQRIPVERLTQRIRKAGERGIVCLVGVQSNQFPRAVDLARQFRKVGFPSMIGGFHVSGCLEMLPELPPEIKQAADEGITLVAGEIEERWADLIKAAYENKLESIYNFVEDKPILKGVPGPILPQINLKYFTSAHSSFDAGRGCPFKCSFCTIINVQGNTMRGRVADDIEKLVRMNYAHGINHIFITDDNFARHPDWESIADRIIQLKEAEGLEIYLMIQVDTLAHRIPRFIEKMARAGCRRVFIGIESVNPDNLLATDKRQNRISEYRRMLQAWRNHGVVTYAGYIIGFPGDTYESIMRDVEYLKRELPLDFAEFFIMTPLPGSKDHQKYYLDHIPMDHDMNRYETNHVVMDHPKMNRRELERAYQDAWSSFYSKEHMFTLLKRRQKVGGAHRVALSLIWFRSCIFVEGVHPLLGGVIRFKGRKSRRSHFPRESFLPYYLRRTIEIVGNLFKLAMIALDIHLLRMKSKRPEYANYLDDAIVPEPKEEKTQNTTILPEKQSVHAARIS